MDVGLEQELQRAIQGDEKARGDLMERLRPRIVLWAASRMSPALRSRVEPDDAAQEILLVVHRDLDRFRGTEKRAFFAWLFRVAENRIRDLATYEGALKRKTPERMSFSQTSPSMAAMRAESGAGVRAALERLRDDYRRVIQLRRLEGLEIPQVAEIMERSENAVRVLYCRAIQALREEMERS